MILGIGTDIVEVKRFEPWAHYPHERLIRVFSDQEIHDSRDTYGMLIPEKLAARFAAKEAFYKALSQVLVTLKLSFKPFGLMSVCRLVSVVYGAHGIPMLFVAWHEIEVLSGVQLPQCISQVSLAHERTTALAFVMIQRRELL